MSAISSFYQADFYPCDSLFRPVRFCHRTWCKLGATFNPAESRISQIAKRICLILLTIPFLLPLTALSAGLVLIGVTIKVWRNEPDFEFDNPDSDLPSGRADPSFFDTIDPVMTTSCSETDSKRSSDLGNDLVRSAPCVFKPENLGDDLFECIALFIRPRERLRLTEISRSFKAAMDSSAHSLWSQYLGDPEYRIWGATEFILQDIHDRGHEIGYKFLAESEQKAAANISPLLQFKAYIELRKQEIVGRPRQFFDQLARLMPGGPVAFSSMPQPELEDVSSIQADQMPAPMIRGKDQRGYTFFAIRLMNRPSATKIALIFRTRKSDGYCEEFEQVPNSVWKNNRLELRKQNDLGYLLTLIQGAQAELNTRPEFDHPKYLKTLQLI